MWLDQIFINKLSSLNMKLEKIVQMSFFFTFTFTRTICTMNSWLPGYLKIPWRKEILSKYVFLEEDRKNRFKKITHREQGKRSNSFSKMKTRMNTLFGFPFLNKGHNMDLLNMKIFLPVMKQFQRVKLLTNFVVKTLWICSLIKTLFFYLPKTNHSILEWDIKISTKFTLKLDKILSTSTKKSTYCIY